MIDDNDFLAEAKDNLALWCDADCVGADLANAAGIAITNKLRAISVLPSSVAQLWPWLENTHIKIFCRFYIDGSIDDNFMSDLSVRISSSFRDGADGATVFMRMRNLNRFVSEVSHIKDDLFFNKSLSVGLDINEIDSSDWADVFAGLNALCADSLTLFLSRDNGDKSDFVGRIYALLNTNMGDWHGALHFVLGQNIARIDQVYRLTQQLRFDKLPLTLFFVNQD